MSRCVRTPRVDALFLSSFLKKLSGRREIKNVHSEGAVPLVGVALAEALRHPDGFPRYRHKRAYSAAVNKFLRENDLLPDGVTIGGVRHTWESRLKAAGIAMDDRGEIMGHSVKEVRGREVYGDDMALRIRQEVAEPQGGNLRPRQS